MVFFLLYMFADTEPDLFRSFRDLNLERADTDISGNSSSDDCNFCLKNSNKK